MFAIRTLICSVVLASTALSIHSPAPARRFRLDSVSVQPGQTWPLNREIVFGFNEPLDFSTVNLNTVRLTDPGGAAVVGDFFLRAPSELVFQPACPTEEDFSDGGLTPGEAYVLFVPDATNSPVALVAASGKRLAFGALVNFQTPDSTLPSVLFDDEAPGPPAILVQPGDADGSWLATGAGDEEFFQLGGGGIATLPGFLAPANLHSDPSTRVTVHVRFDQTLLPFESNINSERMRLESLDLAGQWHPLETEVALVQNCSGSGATVVLSTSGVFPQERTLRVWIGTGLQDIVGDPTLLPLDNLHFDTDSFTDGAGTPIDHGDEWLENFDFGAPADSSLEDGEAPLAFPKAIWGSGRLLASNGFLGTGGPGGDFDFHVPPGTVVIIDTVSSVIVGGPGGNPVTNQTVIGGVVDLRDLYVPATSKLLFSGPNPVTILASGTVTIDGTISVDGFNAAPVFTLNTPHQPEMGALGNCGGGAGGIGSYLTTEVTQRGGPGEGAFGVPTGGGEGGESGWSTNNGSNGINRRAAGGGGGRFARDQRIVWAYAFLCSDQTIYGLDAESGFPGQDTATSSQGAHIPFGGHTGESPFYATPSGRDDFYGRAMRNFQGPNPRLIIGELDQPWAGGGGGAGGDATYVPPPGIYPPLYLIYSHQDKGAGGGGGAGAISFFVMGDVVFGPDGRLTAIGGNGAGGENTSGINHIGGGSGGGAGGHIIVHTMGTLDLSLAPTNPPLAAIDARGGQGGAGAGDLGGAKATGETPYIPSDGKHIGINNGVDNPWVMIPAECQTYVNNTFPGTHRWVVRAAGGDGGPGLVQFHVGNLAGPDATHDIAYPGSGIQTEVINAIRPLPVGFDPTSGTWKDHLLPAIGEVSQAQSKWIALGQPQVAPGTSTPDLLTFLFEGTDPATGLVLTTAGTVDLLPPILAPASPVEAPGLPNVVDANTIYFDAAGFAPGDRIYVDNPALLRGFDLEIAGLSVPIGAAEILPHGSLEILAVTVESGWGGLPAQTGLALLRPRHLRVWDDVTPNTLPIGSSVRIEFQAAAADAEGHPDPTSVFPAIDTWATDPATLTNDAANGDFRFLRFRVTFDLGPNPVVSFPSMDWLKLPFRF